MAVSQWKLAWLTPNLEILWISVSSFRLCESIVALPIIYRLVPRPSRFETRQCYRFCPAFWEGVPQQFYIRKKEDKIKRVHSFIKENKNHLISVLVDVYPIFSSKQSLQHQSLGCFDFKPTHRLQEKDINTSVVIVWLQAKAFLKESFGYRKMKYNWFLGKCRMEKRLLWR